MASKCTDSVSPFSQREPGPALLPLSVKLTKRFISNLATYILGLGIGLVLVGLIIQFKQHVANNRKLPQKAPHRTIAPPDSNPEPGPAIVPKAP